MFLLLLKEIFTEDMVTRRQLAAGQTTRNQPGKSTVLNSHLMLSLIIFVSDLIFLLKENETKCMAIAASQHFGGRPSSLVDDDSLEECVMGRQRPEDMPSKDPENLSFVQHLHG